MRDASQFNISFPYGATSAPYSVAHKHRGDDRACPTGTPVVIEGTTIGLTGATGKVTGPHLHTQEWQASTANVRQPQNAFKGGTVTAATESSDFGKYVTISTADGWSDSYAHLSQINVKVGQVIGGEDMYEGKTAKQWAEFWKKDIEAERGSSRLNAGDIHNMAQALYGRPATEAELKFVGKFWKELYYLMTENQAFKNRINTTDAQKLLNQIKEFLK